MWKCSLSERSEIMAYSRWSRNCRWYTYWDCASGNKIDEQVLTICSVASFTYAQLIKNLDQCIEIACKKYKVTDDEKKELKGYITTFITDVDAEFASKK